MNRASLILTLGAVFLVCGGGLVLSKKRKQPENQVVSSSVTSPAPLAKQAPTNQIGNEPRPNLQLDALSDESITWQERVEICRELLSSESLRDEDIDSLYTLLNDSSTQSQREAWFVVANEIMEGMRRHGIGSDSYTKELSAISQNQALHFVIRDYAVQHLTMWLYPVQTQHSYPKGETDSGLRAEGLTALTSLLITSGLSETSIPGTTLLCLADIHSRTSGEATKEVWETLTPYLKSCLQEGSTATLATQVSALQAVSRSGLKEFHPLVRNLASDQNADPSMRLSAVAALGFYGDSQDLQILNDLKEQEPALHYASVAALKKIAQQ